MAEMTYREALNLAFKEEMRRDPDVLLMGEDVALYGGSFKVTKGLLEEFGEKRVLDTPISEAAFVGASIGAAMTGLKPICEFLTVGFALVAMDQIVNHAAKIYYMFNGQVNLPMVLRGPGGGGHQLGSQHGQSIESYFLHCPGLKVVMPATVADAKGLMKAAIRDPDPVFVMEHEGLYGMRGECPDDPEFITPIGKAQVLREGKDVTLIGLSKTTHQCLQAAELLAKDGIDAEVIDLRSLNPMDDATLVESVKKTNRAVVVYEGWRTGGIGAEVASRLMEKAFYYLDAPVVRIGGKDIPAPYAYNLEKLVYPRIEEIVMGAKYALDGSPLIIR